jgi:hypothetical protein
MKHGEQDWTVRATKSVRVLYPKNSSPQTQDFPALN